MKIAWIAVLMACMLAGAAPPANDFVYPRSLTLDAQGNILVADKDAYAVFKLGRSGGKPAVLVRGQGKPRTPLYHMTGIAVGPRGDIVVSDTATYNVYRIQSGRPEPLLTSKDSPFDKPQSPAFDREGTLYVPDLGESAVFAVKDGKARKLAEVPAPFGCDVDADGNVVVVSASRRQVMRINRSGKVSTLFRGAPLEFPLDVCVAPDGTLLIADGYATAIFRLGSDGKIATVAKGDPLRHPDGVVAEADGGVLVVDPQARALFRIRADGKAAVVHKK